MSQAGPTVVHKTLCPRIAVLQTQDVTDLLQQEIHLPSLAVLLKPWQTAGVERVNLRTSAFEAFTAAQFPLCIDDLSTIQDESQSVDSLGGWLDNVSSRINSLPVSEPASLDEASELETPWYDEMRDSVLDLRPIASHQTFTQPVVYLYATSASHPEPLNALASLYESTSPARLSTADRHAFVDPNILRYYVVIHDARKSNTEDSQALLEQIRRSYGVHCAILSINSFDPNAPAPLEGEKDSRPVTFDTLWQPFTSGDTTAVQGLGNKDVLAIRIFLRDLVVMSLVPWMERNVQSWNESLAASRRGLTGRLFNVGRKYFGGSSSGRSSPANGPVAAYIPSKGYYPHQTTEAQTRRLADFAFMLRDYKLAAFTYDLVRKDFSTEKAWRDYAQASRMTGLSNLMLSLYPISAAFSLAKRPDVDFFLEQAYTAHTAPTQSAYALLDDLKATVLYYETYKLLGETKSAPIALCRTAADHEELSAAILLEQAAIANLTAEPEPQRRKAAFHLCMASQRYEKTGFKGLARRCLLQASFVYSTPSILSDYYAEKAVPVASSRWFAIQNHLHQALGRQAYNLGRSDEALVYYLSLLGKAEQEGDVETGEDDQGVWDDFKLALDHLGDQASTVIQEKKLQFPNKLFDPFMTAIRIPGSETNETNEDVWATLETEFIESFARKKETVTIQQAGTNLASRDETFHLDLIARNPLHATLHLTNLDVQIDNIDNTPTDGVSIPTQEIELQPLSEQRLRIPITCASNTSFRIISVTYLLNGTLKCTESLQKQGKRLAETKEHRLEPTHAQDGSLDVVVRDPIARLEIDLSSLPTDLHAGETITCDISILNSSNVQLSGLHLITSDPNFLPVIGDSSDVYTHTEAQIDTIEVSSDLAPNIPTSIPITNTSKQQATTPIPPITVPIVVRGDSAGAFTLSFMFLYRASPDSSSYIPARRSHVLNVHQSLDIRASIRPSISASDPFSITVQIDNKRIPDTVSIDQIVALGPVWTCHELRSKGADSSSVSLNQSYAVQFGASSSVQAAAVEGTCEPDFTPRQLATLLKGADVTQALPASDQLLVSPAHAKGYDMSAGPLVTSILKSRATLRNSALEQQFATIPASIQRHIFRQFTARTLDIIIFWSIPSRGKHGHHHLADLRLGASENSVGEILQNAEGIAGGLYAESQREREILLANIQSSEYGITDNPITVVQSAPPSVEVDFEQKRYHRLPVMFDLQNISTSTARYRLDLLSSDVVMPNQWESAVWKGITSHVGSLAASERKSIQAMCTISGSVVVNVSNWQLKVTSADEESFEVIGQNRFVRVSNIQQTA